MRLLKSGMIPIIDSFLESELGIPTAELMGRSGRAVDSAVRKILPIGSEIIILAGSGNNGGDGYSAAVYLSGDYSVKVYNVFSKEPRSLSALYWKNECETVLGSIENGIPDDGAIDSADCVIDAIFGTGFSGEIPCSLIPLIEKINARADKKVVAVDIPLGVCADDGSLLGAAIRATVTVSLCVPKVGLYSYPAREYVGEIILSDIGIDKGMLPESLEHFDFLLDEDFIRERLLTRGENTSKGSFGNAVLVVGSESYPGAAFLSSEAALRMGAGYVRFVGCDFLADRLLLKYPEMLYSRLSVGSDNGRISDVIKDGSAVLIGCGSGVSEGLYELILILLKRDITLILDADAINSLSKFGSPSDLKGACARVILTPHPLEFSRISGLSPSEIQADRYNVAKRFSSEYGCTLVLKGAGSVVTDGRVTYINGCGSSALAKAGSGDVLAGLIVSVAAYTREPLDAAAIAVYLHARAGDMLGESYSLYGVTPSDISKAVGKIVAEIKK